MNAHEANRELFTDVGNAFMKETGKQFMELMQTDRAGMARIVSEIADMVDFKIAHEIVRAGPRELTEEKGESAAKMARAILGGYMVASTFADCSIVVTEKNAQEVLEMLTRNKDMNFSIIAPGKS